MLAKCRHGALVVTDRYPQVEVAGFRFDGPQLAKTTGGSWWVCRLRSHELQLYRWMACRIPLLVIRLNIDAETAHARKPDHKLAVLGEKVAVIPQLTFNGAHILDLDARERASAILEGSLSAVRARLHGDPAGLIAVVGCDGTGKSTLTHDLVKMLRQTRPAKRRYLGLVSGETGDKIKRLPLIGVRLERRLAAKSEQAQNMRNQPPGVMAAVLMYGFSLWRAWHLKRVQRLAQRGVLVITDRYPQAEIDGFHYDGPGIGVGRSTQWLIRYLALREQRLYQR
ncbi:atp-binding protein, partial [Lasius niger]